MCLFTEKATFQMIFGKNCKNTSAKKPETRTKVDLLCERANILSEKLAGKNGSKTEKKAIFLRQTLT